MSDEPRESRLPPTNASDALHALCLADPVWAERYEGWTVLGTGGSATVVRTRSRAADEELALKIFTHLDDDGRRRFQQEARHNQRLASPYVVRTHSPFLRAGLAWIELEWVDGADLRHELQRRAREGAPFALDHALRIGTDVARALAAAHEAGVIHRDVKPANVLLPRAGAPAAKLGDFGISRVAGAARVTATGLITGTPQFVAPEVVAGQPADARSDVYSLGLTLYLLLAGNRFPFDVATDAAPARWLEAHARERPRPLRRVVPEADAALDALLERALAKDPAQRPTAGDVVTTLATLCDQGPPSRRGRAARPVRPRRSWLALALLALGASAAGGLLWRPQARRPAAEQVPTPAPFRATPVSEPRTARPPATPARPSSAPAPAPAEVTGLSAALEGGDAAPVLVLRNAGPQVLPPLELALLGEDGARHRAQVGEPTPVGGELWIALDSLTPPVATRARVRRVTLVLADGRRVALSLSRQ